MVFSSHSIFAAGRDSVLCSRVRVEMLLTQGLILAAPQLYRPPSWPKWQIIRAGCHAAPAASLLSAKGWGLIQLDGGADGQQDKMPHVPLFAKPLSHTM